ncbi:hypothetical protein DL546_005390 [Coniochaeta pulveracea]|uniref:Enoyl reductase (ER) domain-containing protein n=1 Tax=Coniochaeta pulveracea TaxID=177199 RepID=A0A420Y9E6_9PEZI|nr:hypothetical protein DL546_005390 [Coniochaeta pulveracea]
MSTHTVFRLPGKTRKSIRDIEVRQEQIPQPAPQQVLIRVRSVALNYRDHAIASGFYPFPVKEDVVPCSDLAGDVVSVGSEVKDIQKGDKVIVNFDLKTLSGNIVGWSASQGGPVDGVLRQHVSVPSAFVTKIPYDTKLSYSQLASIVCTGTTAWNALYGNNPLKPGQTVLFLGTGGVSITGLILAKAAGATTIITSSSDEKLKYVQETYGADHVINYKTTPNWSEKVLEITNGHGADIILENGGAGTIAQSINAVAYGGIVACIGFLAQCPQDQMPDVAAMTVGKGAIVRGIMIGSKVQLDEVARFVTSKNLQLPVEKEFGFSKEEVIAAWEYLASGQHIGKICIKVD